MQRFALRLPCRYEQEKLHRLLHAAATHAHEGMKQADILKQKETLLR
jgi:hypothetical protein